LRIFAANRSVRFRFLKRSFSAVENFGLPAGRQLASAPSDEKNHKSILAFWLIRRWQNHIDCALKFEVEGRGNPSGSS
jgi:hypothetical protein